MADYLAGQVNLSQVLRSSVTRASSQRQTVISDQVGAVEDLIPDFIDSRAALQEHDEPVDYALDESE